MVSVNILKADKRRFVDSRGMIGEFGVHGRMVSRDGLRVIEDPIEMAAEWQVQPDIDGPMIFQSAGQGPQYPEQCKMPNLEAVSERRLGETVSESAAKAACSKIQNEQEKLNCVADVLATGDLDLAAAAAF